MKKIDKKLLKDSKGRPLTQSLFLEIGYNTKYALFTLDDEDKEYNDKIYPSLKKMYLEISDPTEYEFSKVCLLNWKHWLRLQGNKQLMPHFEEWRDELEIKLRSEAIGEIMTHAVDDNNLQAAKWLADKGWDKQAVGRPTKEQASRKKAIEDTLDEDFATDLLRVVGV